MNNIAIKNSPSSKGKKLLVEIDANKLENGSLLISVFIIQTLLKVLN